MAALAAEAEANDPRGSSTRLANRTPDDDGQPWGRPAMFRLAADERAARSAAEREEAQRQLPEIRARLGARYLGELPAGPPDPLLIDRLDPAGHSILYGSGGAGKGTLASWWTVQLVRLGRRVIILDYEAHADEWARRFRGLAGDDGGSAVLWVAPLAASWHGRRGALWTQANDVRELAAAFDADYIVIDSIVPACGGADPVDPGTVAKYAGALEYIGRPALSLAHVPKSGDLTYPYGSAFWHNLARVTWSLSREAERIILTHRKANNYGRLGRFAVDVTWRDDLPREVWERGYSAALADRIDEALGTDSLTVAEIVAALADEIDGETAPPADSIRKTLRRGFAVPKSVPRRYVVEGSGTAAKWRRADG